jgi:hypothetical protein
MGREHRSAIGNVRYSTAPVFAGAGAGAAAEEPVLDPAAAAAADAEAGCVTSAPAAVSAAPACRGDDTGAMMAVGAVGVSTPMSDVRNAETRLVSWLWRRVADRREEKASACTLIT